MIELAAEIVSSGLSVEPADVGTVDAPEDGAGELSAPGLDPVGGGVLSAPVGGGVLSGPEVDPVGGGVLSPVGGGLLSGVDPVGGGKLVGSVGP